LFRNQEICREGFGTRCFPCSKQEYGLIKSIFSFFGILIGYLYLRRAKKFIAISSYIKTRTAHYFPKTHQAVIPNFLDREEFFKERSKSTHREFPENFVLYVGKLAPFKGLDDLIQAFKIAKNISPMMQDTQLFILGPTNPNHTYENQPQDGIQVILDPPRDEVVEAIFRSSCVVIPSIWPEPGGRIVLEGLSAGTKVIGSDIGGIPDMLGDLPNTYLAPPGTPSDLAKILIQALADQKQEIPLEIFDAHIPLSPEKAMASLVEEYEKMVNPQSRMDID
jgi:glycosyltransferase involved in cell wall biosynthesis